MGTWGERRENTILWLLILALVEVLAGTDEVETTVLHREVQSPGCGEKQYNAPEHVES